MCNKDTSSYIKSQIRSCGLSVHWYILGFWGCFAIHPFWWCFWLKCPSGGLNKTFTIALGPVQFHQSYDFRYVSENLFSVQVCFDGNPIQWICHFHTLNKFKKSKGV